MTSRFHSGRVRLVLPTVVMLWITTAYSHVRGEVLDTFTEPFEKSELATDDAGTIHQVNVKLGEPIARGQILARLDSRVLGARLRAAESRAASTARLRAAKATLDQAQRRLGKLRDISDRGHATSTEIQNAQTAVLLAETDVELAQEGQTQNQAEVDRIEAEIERRQTRSPFDGVVTRIHRRPGEYVSPSDPVIITVVRLDRLRAKFYLSTQRAETLQLQQPVALSLAGREVEGYVEYVSPVTDPDGRTVRVDVVIDNPNLNHRSGVPCKLRTPIRTATRKPKTPSTVSAG